MRQIVMYLRNQGINVWVDNEKLVPGTPIWEVEIEKAIVGAGAVVVLLSPDSKTSSWVRREISYAEDNGKRIFPILIAGDERTAVPIRLANYQRIDFHQNEENGLNSLIEVIDSHLDYLEAQERKVREETERSTQKKAEQKAAEKAEREAVEKAAKEKAGRDASEKKPDEIKESRILSSIRKSEKKKTSYSKSQFPYVIKRTTISIIGVIVIILGIWGTINLKNFIYQRESPITLTITATSALVPTTTKTSEPIFIETSTVTEGTPTQISTSTTATSYEPTTIGHIDKKVISPENISNLSVINTLTITDGRLSIKEDFSIVATRSFDGKTIKIRSFDNKNLQTTLITQDKFLDVAFSPSENIIATGSSNNTVQLWDINNGNLLKTFVGHLNDVECIVFSPQGDLLASGSADTTVKLWQVSNGELLYTFSGHTGVIFSAAFSLDGRYLITNSSDNTTQVWDINNLSNYMTFTAGGSNYLEGGSSVSISSDNNILASTDYSSGAFIFKIWDLRNGETLATYTGFDFVLSPIGQYFAYRAIDESKNFEFGDATQLGQDDNISLVSLYEDNTLSLQGCIPISFSPTGTILADSCGNFWNSNDGYLLSTLQTKINSLSSDWTRVLSLDRNYADRLITLEVWGIVP